MYRELIEEICREQNIRCEVLSHGWIIRLTKDGLTRHIVGHHFDGNPAAADRIACDKYACCTLLTHNSIPAVTHELLFNPVTRAGWAGPEGTWRKALDYFHAHNRKVVVKPNEGWQGRDVYLCESPAALEQALHTVFQTRPNACICPFYEIEHEYRVFYVYGACPLAYGKERGADSWKHNLSGGARAFDITDDTLANGLEALAKRSARCVNINFATVDIAGLTDGSLAVMEINAGVAAKVYLEQYPDRREKIKNLYAEAISRMLGY
jgi:hypothetical protein